MILAAITSRFLYLFLQIVTYVFCMNRCDMDRFRKNMGQQIAYKRHQWPEHHQ